MKQLELHAGATMASDGSQRLQLWRPTGVANQLVCLFIMLNPSRADATVDDATVRRCRGFARGLGCGQLRIVNLWPIVTPYPDELFLRAAQLAPRDIERNDQLIVDEARRAHIVIGAWGTDRRSLQRSEHVLRLLSAAAVPVHALRLTKSGQPSHPVRLPGHLSPVRLRPRGGGSPLPRRALSLRQPWAWLLATGHKPIENRFWRDSFRGRFLVHASRGMTEEEYVACRAFSRFAIPAEKFPPAFAFARGGIVGAATLDDVLLPPPPNDASGWRMEGQYGLMCSDPEELPFVACRGHQRWFTVDEETVSLLEQRRCR